MGGIGALRTAAVVLRVVSERIKVRMEREAVVLRRGWLLGLEGDIVYLDDFLVDGQCKVDCTCDGIEIQCGAGELGCLRERWDVNTYRSQRYCFGSQAWIFWSVSTSLFVVMQATRRQMLGSR
jgi:hypothetical protein